MLDGLIDERKKKLETLKKAGENPYPAEVKRTMDLGEANLKFVPLSRSRKKIFLVGRVIGLRDQGGLLFMDMNDGIASFQVIAKKVDLKNYKIFRDSIDVGDFIEVGGTLFKTKRGEKSIGAKNLRIIVKSLRPLPSSFYGLEDTETKLRKRYLDSLLNPEVRNLFIKKARFWEVFRTYLKKEGFLEVETPVLESIPGGADAEPFVTHHNALNTDYYMRISLEIALKKMLIGGFPKIFEIGRIFRNEGISAEHLQDYTQLEFYWAYSNYEELMKMIEKLYKEVIKNTVNSLISTWQGKKINWRKKWLKIDYYEIFKEKTGIDLEKAGKEELFARAVKENLHPEKSLNEGRLMDLLFKKLIRPSLIQPAFLINPPVLIEPLAKRIDSEPNKVFRFQVVACGTELGKGFSEANDPIDQRERFEEQMKMREDGDREAQRLDEEFLEALEYGMPPAAGFGVSERLFSILMDKPVRETVFFPLMKRKES